MSEEMKMSDVWGWDSIPQTYGHYDGFTINGIDRKGNFYGLLFCTEEAAEATSKAVRNHDRLTEENRKLREMLQYVMKCAAIQDNVLIDAEEIKQLLEELK